MLSGSGYSKQRASVFHRPDGFVPADIADFHAQGLFVRTNAAIPEILGLLAVDDHIAQFIDLDFTVRMPNAFGSGAIQAQKLNGFQAFFADMNWLKGFLFIIQPW